MSEGFDNLKNSGYAPVSGLKMYYEIHGTARGLNTPLVLVHGGGSTIDISFGKILQPITETRQVIAFEQLADDAAALLRYLEIEISDFFGYSNGGSVVLQTAIRNPYLVRRLVIASAMSERDSSYPEFWESIQHATPQDMPAELRDAYLRAEPDPEDLPVFVAKSIRRMLEFRD
jgi:pimeloyl-ACP methyl ester carboxylesterase